MDSGPTLKPKVTVKLNYNKSSGSRPGSPTKSNAESTFRPKAKVNSSATVRKTASTVATTSTSTTTTPRAGSPAKLSPRIKNGALSHTRGPNRTLKSPPPAASAPVTPEVRKTYSLRADDSRSRSGSTTSLHHAASFSSFRPSSPSVVSVSLTAASGSSPASPRLMLPKSAAGPIDREYASSSTQKIRSKVSNLAKAASDESSPSLSGPTSPSMGHSTRQPSVRSRAPSTDASEQLQHHYAASASVKFSPASPPPQFYPITTAVPAANPHRFPTNRPPATRNPAAQQIFQSFKQPSSSATLPDQSPSLSTRPWSSAGLMLSNGTGAAIAKVDPASIPLPPHSPPASAISFSSRSSVSVSASISSAASGSHSVASSSTDGGYNLRQKKHDVTTVGLRTTLDNLIQYTSDLNGDLDSDRDRDVGGDFDRANDEHEVKATAKSNRKIADLEITNRSLLAINATLEATKHRQAKEIAELRRKLRESRLILPPRAYRAVKSSLDPSEMDDDEEELSEDSEDGDGEGVADGDETYKRIKVILDTLLKTGQAALEKQVKDFPESGRGTAKVLSPEEVKDWHGTKGLQIVMGHDEHEGMQDNNDDHSFLLDSEVDQDAYDAEHGSSKLMDHEHHLNIPRVSAYNDNGEDEEDGASNLTMTSEDEVAAMTIPAFSPPSSPPPPPILITQPS